MPRRIIDLSTPIDTGHFRWPVERRKVKSHAAGGTAVQPGDIALIRSGWDRFESIDRPEFWTRSPWLTDGPCRWLLQRQVKAVAFDFPQDRCIRDRVTGDRVPERAEMTSHVILLANGVIMFEYLRNMMAISRPRVEFFGLPLKVARCGGASARAIAIEES